ncbi:MAG: cyclic nucleotide-binding protein, partial [Acidithiobacillus ferrivorans]
MSFFDRQPRSARILAKSDDTQVLVLTRARYQRLKVEKPYITVNILEQAIISLDHLFRSLSQNYTDFSTYIYGKGKR